jgi:hypothetical protein
MIGAIHWCLGCDAEIRGYHRYFEAASSLNIDPETENNLVPIEDPCYGFLTAHSSERGSL